MTTSTFPRWQGDTEPAFVFDLCLGLQQRGLQVDVLAPHANGAKHHETIAGMGIYRYRYFFTRLQSLAYNGGVLANLKRNPLNYLLVPMMLLSQAVALRRLLKSTDYHVVHAHWIIPQGLVAAIVLSVTGSRA